MHTEGSPTLWGVDCVIVGHSNDFMALCGREIILETFTQFQFLIKIITISLSLLLGGGDIIRPKLYVYTTGGDRIVYCK